MFEKIWWFAAVNLFLGVINVAFFYSEKDDDLVDY